MKGIPYFFGEIAIQENFIDATILRECLEIQKIQRKPIVIGEILRDKGYLTDEYIQRILQIQHFYRTKLENEYFATLAFKLKYIKALQLRELRNQLNDEVGENPQAVNLAQLAVERSYISQPVVDEILRSPEYKYFTKLKSQNKSTIGNYELVGVVIRLKKSIIYKAIQTELDRVVAVKTLIKECETRDYIQNFFDEAKATARFNHPNLVRIYDTGFENGTYYYAMELVEGDNLSQQLADGERFSVSESVRIIREIAKALEHIHSYHYIHGTINPRNIAVREDKVAKLLDLSGSCPIDTVVKEVKMTKMPQYMAPEHFKIGEKLDIRTDIYCLGATFYRILTGRPPIAGKTLEEIRQNILQEEPKPISDVDFTIPEALTKIVHRMLRKDSSKRYQEISKVLFALKKILV